MRQCLIQVIKADETDHVGHSHHTLSIDAQKAPVLHLWIHHEHLYLLPLPCEGCEDAQTKLLKSDTLIICTD